MTRPAPSRSAVAAAIAPHGDALSAVADHCRSMATDELGVVLPPLSLVVSFVAPHEARVHHDGHAGIRVAVAGLDAFAAPPAGANLRYATCHEVGHLVVAHLRSGRRSPGVVWDEALAHLLATDVFLPQVPDDLGPPGGGDGWRALEVAIGEADADPAVAASLRRCTALLRARAAAWGGVATLLDGVAAVADGDCRADRFLDGLDRAGR